MANKKNRHYLKDPANEIPPQIFNTLSTNIKFYRIYIQPCNNGV